MDVFKPRYELLSKEEILDLFKLTLPEPACCDCPNKINDYCHKRKPVDGVDSCGEICYEYLTKSVKVESKERFSLVNNDKELYAMNDEWQKDPRDISFVEFLKESIYVETEEED